MSNKTPLVLFAKLRSKLGSSSIKNDSEISTNKEIPDQVYLTPAQNSIFALYENAFKIGGLQPNRQADREALKELERISEHCQELSLAAMGSSKIKQPPR